MTRGVNPRYLEIAATLRERAERGEYPPDQPLPSQPRLARELGVSLATLRQALDVLRREGWVKSTQGGATRLAAPVARRVLIVEDDPTIQRLLVLATRESQLEVVAVGNAEDAVAAAEHGRFALLLVDVGLPGRDGVSAALDLRRLQPQARLVFVTANPEHALHAATLGVRPVEILPKPFELSEVIRLVRAVSV